MIEIKAIVFIARVELCLNEYVLAHYSNVKSFQVSSSRTKNDIKLSRTSRNVTPVDCSVLYSTSSLFG